MLSYPQHGDVKSEYENMKNCTRFFFIDPAQNFAKALSLKGRAVHALRLLFPVIVLGAFTLTSNGQVINTHLYLSDPAYSLDRVDPVGSADATTTSSYRLYGSAPSVMVDATSTKVQNTGPITLAHTTGTENNRLMLVGISQKNRLISSVTYGGVALTLVGENVSSGNSRVSIYQMINPPSGTANVVVNFSANPDKGAVVGVTTFYNVNQTTPLGTFVSATGNSTTPSVVASSASNELVYDVVAKRNQSITAGAGQTARYNVDSGWEIYGGASVETGATSTTMSWSGNSSDWCIGAVPIKPASSNYNEISFTQSTPLCNQLTIKSGNTITLSAYLNSVTGIGASPAITAQLKYGSNNVITMSSPSYNSGTGIITWTGSLGADIVVPGGESLAITITNNVAASNFKIDFDSQTKPSKLTIPVLEMLTISGFTAYTAAYPGGSPITSGIAGVTKYLRCTASSPFGPADVTSVSFTITPTGSSFAGTVVNTSGCSKTFEYVWSVPPTSTSYSLRAIVKQGYENTLSDTAISTYDACAACAPNAVDNSVSGSGGNPVVIDVLANDYDPNNNIKVNTLSIVTQANNGIGYLTNNKIVYLPNGSYSGNDTITYRICDSTSLCDTARIFIHIDPAVIDPCSDATRSQTYYMPFSENEARVALDSSTNLSYPGNNIRTIISIRVPYAGMRLTWDHWEDGYETNILNPVQSTTLVWGDGNPFNGIAPGYPSDIIPNNGSIVLDNTMATNPRVPANIYYDGRDKLFSSGQIAVTQVCGEPSLMSVQCMKTNVSGSSDYGTSFTVPVGQNYNSQDFRYTSLFIRASAANTEINIDKDNDGVLETTAVINEGEVYHVNGSVMSGATIAASAPIGVDLHFGGNDWYSSRDIPLFPASWYSHTYYSPVPTTSAGSDSAVVMLYNSLNRSLNINYSSGIPSSGTITIPAKSVYRFALDKSATAAYKFVNPTGESFTAIEIVDSYTPGGGGNTGSEFDWAFNLISESRLTDFTTIAWAPGSTDGTRNDNPIWVTPIANTTVYVKYNGNITSGGSVSPCGFYYDVSYPLSVLNHKRLLDGTGDNDQSGMAVYTCDGVKIAAVYGEDPSTAQIATPSWDVGSTLQPFCKGKLIFANDDYYPTLINQPVTTVPLLNDFGFLATIDPATVTTIGLLQPSHGTVSVNSNGTILYRPNNGYVGNDTFEYQVCSTPAPVVCDIAKVIITINSCPSTSQDNILTGQVFIDSDKDGINDDGGTGYFGRKVYLYVDGNCSGVIDNYELMDSVTVDSSGYYQFVRNPQKIIADDFDNAGTRSCANGTDGNTPWATDWVDAGDPSVGFCNTGSSAANTDAEIMKDGSFSYGLRLKDNNVSATRTFNLSGATKAFLTFSYRRKSTTLAAGEDVYVQASSNGTAFTTIYTISGNGTADANYVTVYNQDIISYASATTFIRFLTGSSVDDVDTVYIDDVKIQFLKYNQCYITKLDPASVPSNEYVTTAAQKTVTFTGSAVCNSAMDFGIAKISIGVVGTLYNDANALVDGVINGTATGSPGGSTVYAYLIDANGKVKFKSQVNAGTGTFSFPIADVTTSYTLRLSTVDVAVLSTAPAAATFPTDWVSTGDSFGTNNSAGSNNEGGTPDSAIPVTTTTLNISNINFGIERLPNSDNKYASINHPQVGDYVTLNGVGVNPPVLSGSDPEDCPGGCLMTNKTVIIDTLPGNAELYYNNVLVTQGQQITNFNANLFKAKVTDATVGDSSINFRYSYVDLAAKKDPTPAIYEIIWAWALPADGLTAFASLEGNTAMIKWKTVSENNTDHFIIERSIDNISFTPTGNSVPAAGNSETMRNYQMPDDISMLQQFGIIYYRVKLVDIDGKSKYSNIISVRQNKSIGITAWPNPFKSDLSLGINASHNTELGLQITDATGRIVYSVSKPLARGNSQLTISKLGSLPKGFYLLRVTDKQTAEQTTYKLVKE